LTGFCDSLKEKIRGEKKIHITSGGKDKEIGMLEKAAADFAKKQLAPEPEAKDAYPFGPFFDGVVQKAFELNFFAVMLPEMTNGMGMGVTAFAAVLEGLRQEDSSLGGILFTNAAARQVMLAAGAGVLPEKVTAAQRLADFLIAPVFNNPLDVRNMARAKPDGNGYRLSGNVEYVVLGAMAGQALIPGWELCTRAAALWVQKSDCDVTTDGIQVLGGVGYMKDYGREKSVPGRQTDSGPAGHGAHEKNPVY